MQVKKFEFCITATYEEYYDIWAEDEAEARQIFLQQSARSLPDEIKCLSKNRQDAEITNLDRIAG